jgi:hypothetical protein
MRSFQCSLSRAERSPLQDSCKIVSRLLPEAGK